MNLELIEKFKQALTHLQKEMDALRTGRANPALVENIMVEAYGSKMPLMQVASISVPDARQILIQPWDNQLVKDIERALSSSSVGISPVVEGAQIRLPLPAMTEERRRELVRVVHQRAEECRVRIRAIREDQMKEIRSAVEDGNLSRDMGERQKESIQKETDAATKQVADLLAAKEQEIMSV